MKSGHGFFFSSYFMSEFSVHDFNNLFNIFFVALVFMMHPLFYGVCLLIVLSFISFPASDFLLYIFVRVVFSSFGYLFTLYLRLIAFLISMTSGSRFHGFFF